MKKRDETLRRMRSLSNPESLEGMRRFGINTKKAYGVPIPQLRSLAREIGRDHKLAREPWTSQVHEARILASMIDDPEMVTEGQMEEWVRDFDSWDVCDQCCGNLFDKTKLAYQKAVEWSFEKEEYVKRAGFVLMAELAVHDKRAPDREFEKFLSNIESNSADDRNFQESGQLGFEADRKTKPEAE